MIRIRRVYEPPTPSDGVRVLIDRLWPRGMRKQDLPFDLWAKDLAPSPRLRQWFGHAPARFAVFAERYAAELDTVLTPDHPVLRAARKGHLTLLYAARDPQINHAVVLQRALRRALDDAPQ